MTVAFWEQTLWPRVPGYTRKHVCNHAITNYHKLSPAMLSKFVQNVIRRFLLKQNLTPNSRVHSQWLIDTGISG